ncbi:twin-arginine translocase TatA/TatE family subunit [Halapricum sp. CBA1109]|uniref:twin-arginine translocase TatA/TatE family subunit n=1 Tax=Halapricum sp. CBA1109 TaxID=2668068 RepID=UPI0012F7CE8A|nr:twin-arginine translocase TatA/TatE family subunit [Halapricum sp. CBA1109]MUV90058.1 twin-arginine translocase TatA/TatE family subunit [Halapricum sp. CBA1109]
MAYTILQFGIPGGPELLVVLLLAVLLFGANKIPKLARSSGQAIGEFQKGREQVEQELEEIKDGGSDEEDVAADAGTGADTTTDATVESEVESETTSN